MIAQELQKRYETIKDSLKKNKQLTQEQKNYYLLGWIDCSLYIVNKEQNND